VTSELPSDVSVVVLSNDRFSKRPVESKLSLRLQTSLPRRILSLVRRARFSDPTLGLK
jgi:hypothetical protein